MTDFLNKLTLQDLINEIKYTLDDEMLDEFVSVIKEKFSITLYNYNLNIILNVYVCFICFY